MRRLLPFLVVLVSVLSMPMPASADTSRVNAAVGAVAWDEESVDGAICNTRVLQYGTDPQVILECTGEEGSGRAWVRVLVPDVAGHITAVRVHREGDCDGIDIRWRKRNGDALVTASVTAESQCWVETVRVLSTG